MRIYTYIRLDGFGNIVESQSYEWEGDLASACGAPSGQTQLAQAESNYYNTLTAQATQEFSEEQGLFSDLTSIYEPIFNAGPNQYGYSQAETNMLDTEAASGTAEDYNAANRAVKETLAAEGGSSPQVPSGINVKEAESTAEAGAEQLASEQNQIVQAGYAQGYNEWLAAAQGLGEAGSVFSTANQAGGVAVSGGSSANQTYTDIAQENESPFNAIIGGLSGAATATINENPGDIFG